MKLGADPKKVAILGGLLLVAVVIAYFNYFSGDSDSKPTPPAAFQPYQVATAKNVAPPASRAPEPSGIARDDRRRAKNNIVAGEFSFRQGGEPGEDKPDPASIDPTLRLDLLAKLQQVEAPAALRNIFQYGAAPPPPSAKLPELPKNTPKIAINQAPAAPY